MTVGLVVHPAPLTQLSGEVHCAELTVHGSDVTESRRRLSVFLRPELELVAEVHRVLAPTGDGRSGFLEQVAGGRERVGRAVILTAAVVTARVADRPVAVSDPKDGIPLTGCVSVSLT